MGKRGRSAVVQILKLWNKNPSKDWSLRLLEELSSNNDGYKVAVLRLINVLLKYKGDEGNSKEFKRKEIEIYLEKLKKNKNLLIQKEREKLDKLSNFGNEGLSDGGNLNSILRRIKKVNGSNVKLVTSILTKMLNLTEPDYCESKLLILEGYVEKLCREESSPQRLVKISLPENPESTCVPILLNKTPVTKHETSPKETEFNELSRPSPSPPTPTIPFMEELLEDKLVLQRTNPSLSPKKHFITETETDEIAPRPPPPMPKFSASRTSNGICVPCPPPMSNSSLMRETSKDDLVPQPKNRLRSLRWRKITDKIIENNKTSLWNDKNKLKLAATCINLKKIENMFMDEEIRPIKESSSNLRKTKILDPKRSLRVNVFIRQFRIPVNDIITNISKLDKFFFTGDQLKDLFSLLPNKEEISALRHVEDPDTLQEGELFLAKLIGIQHFELRIEVMLFFEEYTISAESLTSSLENMIQGCVRILENEELHYFLIQILIAGNYLNYGKYSGNARGFSIFSLNQVWETRTSVCRYNLLHCLIEDLEKRRPEVVDLPKSLEFVGKISKISTENKPLAKLREWLKGVVERTRNIEDDGELMEKIKNVKNKFDEQNEIIEEYFRRLDAKRNELADFFCEKADNFPLNELFEILQTFLVKFTQCCEDLKAEKLRKERQHTQKVARESKEKQFSFDGEKEIFDILTNEKLRLENHRLKRSSKDHLDRRFEYKLGHGNGRMPSNCDMSDSAIESISRFIKEPRNNYD